MSRAPFREGDDILEEAGDGEGAGADAYKHQTT